MPSSAVVQEQLTRIVVQVVGCEPEAVVPAAWLSRDLGVDSLSIVEIAEALGQSFDIYIPDARVDSLVTVRDAVNAVVHHDPDAKPPMSRSATAVSAMSSTRRQARPLPADEIERRVHKAWKFAGWFVVVGFAVGAVLGLGGAALINASGIGDVTPVSTPTPTAATTTKAKPKPTATTAPKAEERPKPTLEAASTAISPGEKLRLTGTFPDLDRGAIIQVQVKDKSGPWDDFPVTTTTTEGGSFSTVIFTSRTGERQIRMLHRGSNTTTPAVTITIG
ncbi:MAG: acyl carrier protein [Aeromicrobium sp.]